MNKAYVVSSLSAEASVIVWTMGDESMAKSIGRNSDWLCDEDWTDLRCKRKESLDGKRLDGYLADGMKIDDQRLMRNLGWREVDGMSGCCTECDLSPWEDIPESHLNEDDVCRECVERTQKMKETL